MAESQYPYATYLDVKFPAMAAALSISTIDAGSRLIMYSPSGDIPEADSRAYKSRGRIWSGSQRKKQGD
jgi:hypothetical protein